MRYRSMALAFAFTLGAMAFTPASFAAESSARKQVTAEDLAKTPPDATLDFEGAQLRLMVGGSRGKGVLHFKGKDYPFTARGVSVGGAGYTEVHGTGTVHFLKKVEDFAGTYTGVGAGAAVVKGKGASQFENKKGVIVTIKSKSDGVAMNLGVSAITVTLAK